MATLRDERRCGEAAFKFREEPGGRRDADGPLRLPIRALRLCYKLVADNGLFACYDVSVRDEDERAAETGGVR